MISPTTVISVSLVPGTYITDGLMIPSSNLLAFATSNDTIKLYNAATGSFVRDIRDHNGQITDMAQFGIAGSPTSVLISSQRDTGILITDLRDPTSKPRYLTELQSSGAECFGIAVSPSGNQFALSAGTDIHILDPRMNFRSMRHIPDMHTDVITKLRFVSENVIVSGGEDMMLNFIDANAKSEGDLLVSSITWGEAPNRLNVIGGRFVTATGTMEGSIVQPIPNNVPFDELQNGDWPLELNIPRPPLGSYIVDFVQMSNFGGDESNDYEIGALVGERPGGADCLTVAGGGEPQYMRDERTGNLIYPGDINGNNRGDDDDGGNRPQALSILRVTRGGVQPSQRIQLVPTHKDDVRCVIPLPQSNGSRLVTAGEDGTICYWDLSRSGQGAPLQAGQQRKPQRLGTGGSQNHNDNDDDNNNNSHDDQDHDESSRQQSSNSTCSSGGGKERRDRGTKIREQHQQHQQHHRHHPQHGHHQQKQQQ